ncbi:hypothetical protein EST38_g1194 [Candolleomyces aberdarensis]|uniref:Peptide hydrolase n=1 Tax=Candolleomyces aberdarensis TaxID=2316362 RepID=A0A4Q2DYU5_9AGAR|nr:hypothetical protein EST38_g1194 [Candolleomyces aberdarensis]
MPTIQAAAGLGLLLLAPLNSTLFLEAPCLSQNFLGHYRNGETTSSLFRLETPDCVQVASNSYLSQEPNALLAAPSSEKRLVWIEHESVDPSLLRSTHQGPLLDDVLDALSARNRDETQQTLSTTESPASPILYRTDTSVLVALPSEEVFTIDTRLPRFWKSTIVPESPSAYRVVSDDSVERVRRVLSELKFSPAVASVVNNISIPHIQNDIRFLTGEDGQSGIVSRHSFSPGARTAANWIKNRIEETGAKCRLENFRLGFAPNVICRYASIVDSNDTIILSGHYDSRGSFGSVRAPGGNDDGSGTTGILSIARTIARKRIRFHTNLELVTFAGEEQGLVGSDAYARQLRAQDASIVLMIQADMTAYRAPDEPLQLGLPERIGTPEVTALVGNISALYSPELTVGYSSACCSDHQSFITQGFPASQVFERAGPIADPMYHNSGDLSERVGYDVNQLYAIAKVQFATALHVAGFEIADSE